MLKKSGISHRIRVETHMNVLTLDDILGLFENNQQKIRQKNDTGDRFEFGILNKTRYWKTVKYVLNLGWIYCEAQLVDYWLEHVNGQRYFHEQKSVIKWKSTCKRGTPQCMSSYDIGPGLSVGFRSNKHVRSTFDKIANICPRKNR